MVLDESKYSLSGVKWCKNCRYYGIGEKSKTPLCLHTKLNKSKHYYTGDIRGDVELCSKEAKWFKSRWQL